MQWAEAGQSWAPRSVDVTEDWSAIRIPSAMDYADNYVTGVCSVTDCIRLPTDMSPELTSHACLGQAWAWT